MERDRTSEARTSDQVGAQPARRQEAKPLSAIIRAYTKPRLLLILVLGFASGLPLALTLSTLTAWLKEAGVDKSSIGLFAAITTPYALKFLWSPLMDGTRFPLLGRLGRRRGWIIATQIALIASIVMLGFSDPATNPWNTAFWAFIVALCSASQDIVIDAYRVEILPREEYGAGSAMVQFGYRVGMLVSGAGSLYLAYYHGWTVTYCVMAGLMAVGMLAVLFAPEPPEPEMLKHKRSLRQWIKDSVISPFTDFMRTPGWWMLLLFIMLYKMGDAFLGVMTNPFLIEIGFTLPQIASVVKIFGFGATLLGLFLGAIITDRLGVVRSLWICGLGHALTNLMFLVQARVGADINVLALGITLENLSGGMTATAFVAFLSSLCRVNYTATQYALLSSLAVVGRTWLSTAAGWTAERFGWEIFFIIAVALAFPSLILLWWMVKKGLLNSTSLPAASSSR